MAKTKGKQKENWQIWRCADCRWVFIGSRNANCCPKCQSDDVSIDEDPKFSP